MSRARYSCLMVVVVTLVLSLVLSPNVAQAQATPDYTVPNISVDPNVLLGGDQAVPDEVAETVRMRESLSSAQLSNIQAILDSHNAELQQIKDELSALRTPDLNTPITQGNNVFIPFARGSGNTSVQDQTNAEKATQLAAARDNAADIRQVSLKLDALQSQIDQEVASVLTATQREAYAKNTAKLQRLMHEGAGKIETIAAGEVSASASSDCLNGAYYASFASYYAYYALVYGYYDYYYYGNVYANAGYFAGVLAEPKITSGLLNAGGAYFDVVYGFGYDSNGWSDKAYADLVSGEGWAYWTYLYHYYSWQYYNSSTYGYYSYLYGSYANLYAYYARLYENYC